MELLVNDNSAKKQFENPYQFFCAVDRLLRIRKLTEQFGLKLQVHSRFSIIRPLKDEKDEDISIGSILGDWCDREKRTIFRKWIDRPSPDYLYGDMQRTGNEYFECRDDLVTDSAIGEAAFRKLHEHDCGLVSMQPTDWSEDCPLRVVYKPDDNTENHRIIELDNWWCEQKLKAALENISPRNIPDSWKVLREMSKRNFERLTFFSECFDQLFGHPFSQPAANRLYELLKILNEYANSIDSNNRQVNEEILNKYFTGENSWFSDSSKSEKNKYKKQLTFSDPEIGVGSIFLPWHGKVKHPTTNMPLRLHFSWPIRIKEPVHIAYIGPKRTMR